MYSKERDYNTLLPDYEEAISQSMKQQPPPSYSVAMAGTGHPIGTPVVTQTAPNQTATGVTVVLPPVNEMAAAQPVAATNSVIISSSNNTESHT